MLINSIGVLAASALLAIPFMSECEADPGGTGEVADCCESSLNPKCEDQGVTECVCALDSYCCSTAWDSKCVQKAEAQCDAGCPEAK